MSQPPQEPRYSSPHARGAISFDMSCTAAVREFRVLGF